MTLISPCISWGVSIRQSPDWLPGDVPSPPHTQILRKRALSLQSLANPARGPIRENEIHAYEISGAVIGSLNCMINTILNSRASCVRAIR